MHAEPAPRTEPQKGGRSRASGETRLERLQRMGLRRLGTAKRGFRYVRADGKPATKQERERIEAMRLPPAWTDVAIAPSPSATLQAVGRDAAGRWQYRYHTSHRQRREEEKFQRIVGFARALPKMRVKAEARDAATKKTVIKKTLVAAVKEAAEHLGNTPAVARSSYIYPSVLAMFERGQVVDRYFESVDELATSDGLHCSEEALLDMLDEAKH